MSSNFFPRPAARSWLILLLTAEIVGCTAGCRAPKKRPGIEGYNALIRAQQEALAVDQLKQPSVYVHGPVQKHVVPWREDLTLAEALLEAGYTQVFSPHAIRVSRQGKLHNIDVRRLLRGTENPVLEQGDVVEVIR